MAEHHTKLKRFFPLKTIDDVCQLFQSQLSSSLSSSNKNKSPNLSMLSIVCGLIEFGLTTQKEHENVDHHNHESFHHESTPSPCCQPKDIKIPTINWSTVDAMMHKFSTRIKGSVDLSMYPKKTSRELIKKISDVIWSHLTRSYYKDRAHLQTIYSYLTGNKLDCFGVAYAVVAACQLLGLDDVKLALSEDHAWVVFGDNETCEVTWHGKGNEDKRGQPVQVSNSWLYLNGHYIECTKWMAVAALVSAMNPSINANQDSEELSILQQQLLWLLYNEGHLSRYPMAIGNLGDLEDVCPSIGARKSPIELFYEAIEVSKKVYHNHHVYPYTYLGGYLYRNGRFKEALKTWSDAAQVIKQYNYTRDDEEIYKEFLEIANELIPHMVKVVSAGGCEPSGMSSTPLLQDPQCFGYLLTFYDGLCGWEEGSSTPVLHIGWAKPLVSTMAKFPAFIRSKIDIKGETEDDEEEDEEDSQATEIAEEKKADKTEAKENANSNAIGSNDATEIKSDEVVSESEESELIKSLVKDIGESGDGESEGINPTIDALAAACSENILNPGFLLGQDMDNAFKSSNDINLTGLTTSTRLNITDNSSAAGQMKENIVSHSNQNSNQNQKQHEQKEKTTITLTSQKMAGLKHLLLADKLNTSAIQLQLTAQSQVNINKRSRPGVSSKASSQASNPEFDLVSTTTTTIPRTSKRVRRE